MEDVLLGTAGGFLLKAATALIPEPERDQVLRRQNSRYNRVLGPRSEYVKYLHRPICRELWDLQPAAKAKATCSFATVYKRNGIELRKILMTCPFNEIAIALQIALGAAFDYGM